MYVNLRRREAEGEREREILENSTRLRNASDAECGLISRRFNCSK